MDWFQRLTGFAESDYDSTREQLRVEGAYLRSLVNDRSIGIGELQTPSLSELRQRFLRSQDRQAPLRLRHVTGEAGSLHTASENAGALFQVASQFNLLEMVDWRVTPEQGVTGYENDWTQGPACAVAAGGATIYRNYFVPVGGGRGQTATRQLNMLEDLGAELAGRLGCRVSDLYEMRNGYALGREDGLRKIAAHLASCSSQDLDLLRGRLRIGLHLDVEVTSVSSVPGHRVAQPFCSALPIAYGDPDPQDWEPFARLVLQATYEATLLSAVLNLDRGGSPTVFLTRVGGGVFGNDAVWIDDAIDRAFDRVRHPDLDVRMVSRR